MVYGTFNMYDGTIQNNNPTGGGGGGVWVNGGTFTMRGGSIQSNSSSGVGGGVQVYKNGVSTNGTFNMYGGTINNNDGSAGGAVHIAAGNTFNMHGGVISGNTARSANGGVIVDGGTFTMDGGTINGNTATNGNGNNVYLNTGVMTMTGGTIDGGFSHNDYVAVTFDANGGTGTMSDQYVKKNTATTVKKNEYYDNTAVKTEPAFIREGYIFEGWCTNQEGTGTTYAAGTDSITVSQNTTLYAKWSASDLIAGHTLSLDGNIAINFYLNPAAAGMTANQVTADNFSYSFAWVDQADTKAKVDVAEQARQSQAFTVSDDGKYIIVTCHVCAAEMTCGVNASFTLGEKSDSEVYSVRDYCDTVFTPTADWLTKYKAKYPDNTAKSYDNLVALVKKMLDYGAKAQTVFGIKTGDLANTGVDYSMPSGTPDFDAAIQAANGRLADNLASSNFFGENFKAPSLVFLDYSTLKLYFENKDGSLSTSGLTPWNSYFYIKHENIAAAQLDTLWEFTVSGKTFSYSALDYAKVLANSANTDNANLAKALYWYNQAANAYFG